MANRPKPNSSPPTGSAPTGSVCSNTSSEPGSRRQLDECLPDLADSDSIWLANLIRRLSHETPAAESAVLDRLLEWLLPVELLNCLVPDRAAQAMRWADGLAGDALKAWRPVFATLLRDQTPAFVAVPGGPGGPAGSSGFDRALARPWCRALVVVRR